ARSPPVRFRGGPPARGAPEGQDRRPHRGAAAPAQGPGAHAPGPADAPGRGPRPDRVLDRGRPQQGQLRGPAALHGGRGRRAHGALLREHSRRGARRRVRPVGHFRPDLPRGGRARPSDRGPPGRRRPRGRPGRGDGAPRHARPPCGAGGRIREADPRRRPAGAARRRGPHLGRAQLLEGERLDPLREGRGGRMIQTRVQVTVRYAETDMMGIVYHANYLPWFEVGRTTLLKELGAPCKRWEGEGFRLPVLEIAAKFLRPAVYDDTLEVTATLRERPL